MTTTSNPIPTKSIVRVNRKWTIVVGAALGVTAATMAASAVQSGSAPAREADPSHAYTELTPLIELATSQGLSGLSPASLRPLTD